jgi:DnaJ homolog subfamily C member 13
LPHIAQAMLAGSPELTETSASIITELIRFNPSAMVKLYLTGVFFYALAYTGSNWESLAQLLYVAHLEQSFHSDAANLTSESSLGRRSILGSMLPESMVCVLANRGPKTFTETLLANVDNPEVIWKYSMREKLIELITQHLGDLGARLAANPCTLYDYCPIPRIIYPELENELWCHNYYLANLTDTVRFPDWPVVDPVGLMRSVLDAWRLEMEKSTVETLNDDDAYNILGVPPNSDATEIRKAYRKLAMKYHPDKNPQGRDMFEKIQKAYEFLNAARYVWCCCFVVVVVGVVVVVFLCFRCIRLLRFFLMS